MEWGDLYREGQLGQLMELLSTLPRERWAERNNYGSTFLHYVCCGPNMSAVVALVQSGLVDVNARSIRGSTPAHYAASHMQHRALEVLCATGADLRARDTDGYAPIDNAICANSKGETVRVLVANGVRLSTVREDRRSYITPELEAFERGVLRCRSVTVALLRVKKAANLWRWDKFLLKEVAIAVWATRYEEEWQ